MSTSTKPEIETLRDTLDLSIQKTKRPRPRSATLVQTNTGHTYEGASITSDSSLFEITSEHVALIHATAHNDFSIDRITTLTESTTASPISLKILRDYAARTDHSFAYKLVNLDGKTLLDCSDINETLKEYTSSCEVLSYTRDRHYSDNHYGKLKNVSIDELRKYARLGMSMHFLSEEGGSRYGCAIATKTGDVYAGGAYGSPDKRLGLHAEMATITSTIMDGAKDITHLAIISEKYKDSPCPMCGHCRQFLAEILDKVGGSPKIISLSSDTDTYSEHTLEELLPNKWESKVW